MIKHELIPRIKIPVGREGDFRVDRIRVREEEARDHNFELAHRATLAMGFMSEGIYYGLYQGKQLISSDFPYDLWGSRTNFLKRAQGNVLINGLGLGILVNACLLKDSVEHVTVVEKYPEVINLIGHGYKNRFGRKVTLVQADALTWTAPKGAMFDCVYHDIWHVAEPAIKEQQQKLHRKYGKKCYWQDSWGKDVLKIL